MAEAEAPSRAQGVPTYRLTTISHLVEVATRLPSWWFRGQSKVYGTLTPRVFRRRARSAARLRRAEVNAIGVFRTEAPVRGEAPPGPDDYLSWLCLMQHHGAPTRLLDWTRSSLVGAYFAVTGRPEEDGELWALHPHALNMQNPSVGEQVPFTYHPVVVYLAKATLWGRKKLLEECELEDRPCSPVAILPDVTFLRMQAQDAAFTIHPFPGPETKTVQEALADSPRFVRYVIPKSAKGNLRVALSALRVQRSRLFPDLDGLGQFVGECWEEHLSLDPSGGTVEMDKGPPTCGGPWQGGAERKE